MAPPPTKPSRPAARTRTSAAWLGACLAAAVLVVLIVFVLQNTGNVEVSFLWMQGSLPLAISRNNATRSIGVRASVMEVGRRDARRGAGGAAKLGACNRTEAAATARERGWL